MKTVGRRFRFEWRTALLTALLLPMLMSLGVWQLHRAGENREMMMRVAQQRTLPPVDLEKLEKPVDIKDWHYLPVIIRDAVWRAEHFLLDNQKHRGRIGYQVIGVVELPDGRVAAVNRGWLEGSTDRTILPQVPEVAAGGMELAELYCAESVTAENDWHAESGWPKRIVSFNLPALKGELKREIFPCLLRLQERSPSALEIHWPVVNITPEKNIGYAIQWFAMSLALIVFYLALSFRRDDQPGNGI